MLWTMQCPTRKSLLQGFCGHAISAKVLCQLFRELLCLDLVKEPIAAHEFLEPEHLLVHADLPLRSFLA